METQSLSYRGDIKMLIYYPYGYEIQSEIKTKVMKIYRKDLVVVF